MTVLILISFTLLNQKARYFAFKSKDDLYEICYDAYVNEIDEDITYLETLLLDDDVITIIKKNSSTDDYLIRYQALSNWYLLNLLENDKYSKFQEDYDVLEKEYPTLKSKMVLLGMAGSFVNDDEGLIILLNIIKNYEIKDLENISDYSEEQLWSQIPLHAVAKSYYSALEDDLMVKKHEEAINYMMDFLNN